MNREQAIAILNELLSREQRALAPRLFEATTFISRLSVTGLEIAQRIAEANLEYREQLTEAVLALGGSPGPRASDLSTADLHYQELHYVWPRLIRDHEALLEAYHVAAARLAGEPVAEQVVKNILNSHERELAGLKQVRGEPIGAATG
jgi:hypothetical protein